MILSKTEQKAIAFFSEHSDSWLCFKDQNIIKTYRGWHKIVKKLEALEILKAKLDENSDKGRKLYTIKRNAEPFGETIRKIVESE